MSKMFVGQIEIDIDWNLGHMIFKGKLKNGCLVAVKEGPIVYPRIWTYFYTCPSALPHQNVIQYWIREETRAAIPSILQYDPHYHHSGH